MAARAASAVTASSTVEKKWSSPMRAARPLRRRLSCRCAPARATPKAMLSRSQAIEDLAHGPDPVKSMSDMPMASRTNTRAGPGASARAARPHRGSAPRWRTRAAWRTARRGHPAPVRRWTSGRAGVQLVVPGMRPRTCNWGRELRRMRSRMARPTATAMPCSTPISTTARSVTAASPNSKTVEAGDGDAGRVQWKSRKRDEDEDGGQRRQRHVLEHPGERDEQEHAGGGAQGAGLGATARRDQAPVRGGLAFTGKEPTSPATTLPAPTPRKSRPGVDVVAALLGEGPRGRRSLGHDDEGHHGGQRGEAPQRGPRQPGQPEVGRPALDRGRGRRRRGPAGPGRRRARWRRPGR